MKYLIACFALASICISPAAFAQGDVCKTDPRYGALDFYVGEWQLESAAGEVLGSSRVTKRPDGCAITESFRGTDGRIGETLTFLDPSDGSWRQVGVGSFGDVFRNQGRAADDKFEFEGVLAMPDGETMMLRGEMSRESDLVRFRVERQQGGSWELLEEGQYRPVSQVTMNRGKVSRETEAASSGKKGKEPKKAKKTKKTDQAKTAPVVAAAPSSVEVVPVPEDRRVQTLSTRTSDPVEIEVDSPMVLQFEVGRVEDLPAGYGWNTTETAQYVCRGTRIQKVSVERKKRKGAYTLDVTSEIHTKQYIGKYALLVELLDGDEVVAMVEDPQFKAGRGVPQQALDGGVLKTLSLEIDPETFDRLFSDSDNRPELRVQLTVF